MTKFIGIHFNITFIGAGNVAWHLAQALYDAGHHIVQVYSRSMESAVQLARLVGAKATNSFDEIEASSHIYIYALKDDALQWVVNHINVDKGLHIHTSGSMPMSVFAASKQRYGCMYPLQTFSKGKSVDFRKVPFFIEANSKGDEVLVSDLVRSVSQKVYSLSSEDRPTIHLAGVLVSNFTNLMYWKAAKLLEEKKIPFDVMKGLMTEAVNKAKLIGPENAQTGPAVRDDRRVMDKHLQMLASDPQWQEVYILLSELIQQMRR